MCLPPANARIWPNPLLYSAVYHRYSLKSFQLCKSAQTYWYRKYFEHIAARFQGDSSCLTIDNIKPELCPNLAPLYNPMSVARSVVDNSAPLFFHSSHFNCNNNKFNPLSRVLKENINKIYKMQHFTTLGNAAYKFFKTFRANPAWAKCVGRDEGGGLNIFAKIDSTRAQYHRVKHTEDYLRDKSVRCLFDYVCKCVRKWRVHVWPPCS